MRFTYLQFCENRNITNTFTIFWTFQNDSEHVGEIFQDEDNMAAILMRRQLENGDLLMVCILYFRICVFFFASLSGRI